MMTAGVFLRVSLSALLTLSVCGFPPKGSKSTQQSSSGTNAAGANFAAYRGVPAGRFTPVSSGHGSIPVVLNDPSAMRLVVKTSPVLSGLSSTVPVVGYSSPSVPVQVGYGGAGSAVQVGYAGSTQAGAPQSGLPVNKWVVDPQLVPAEEESADSRAFGSSDVLYPAPQPPSGPVLQSGETSSVVKEAELGNYQQQTEEFGYPADPLVSGQGFGSLVVPASGLGGYWGSPYPDFDYRLLYGMYPLGTYSTFNQHHEKGKDYYQSIHYLKEHEDGGQGQVQQKKVFQGAF